MRARVASTVPRMIQTVAAFAIRDARSTGSQPALRMGPASPTVRTAKQTIATRANATPAADDPRAAPAAVRRPGRSGSRPTVASAAPTAWSGARVSPRKITASTTVSPPYAATTGVTTDTGPIRSAVKNAR